MEATNKHKLLFLFDTDKFEELELTRKRIENQGIIFMSSSVKIVEIDENNNIVRIIN